jgi:hypothetical protein
VLRAGRLCSVVVRQLWLLSHSLLGLASFHLPFREEFRQRAITTVLYSPQQQEEQAAAHGKRRFGTPISKAQVAQSSRFLIATYLCLVLVLGCGPVSAHRACGMATDMSRLRSPVLRQYGNNPHPSCWACLCFGVKVAGVARIGHRTNASGPQIIREHGSLPQLPYDSELPHRPVQPPKSSPNHE